MSDGLISPLPRLTGMSRLSGASGCASSCAQPAMRLRLTSSRKLRSIWRRSRSGVISGALRRIPCAERPWRG